MTELTPEVLAKIRDILSPSQAQTKRATHVSDSALFGPSIYGYIVSYNGFETFVSRSEALSVLNAEAFALNESLQAWYLNPRDTTSGPTTVSVSHDEYCDWLRRKE